MNKKKIGALLVGATLLVGAMGSFAYFTSHVSIGGRVNGTLQELKIQNGQVVITSKVASNGLTVSDWTYDVAKLSTTEDGDTPQSIEAFEDKHRSPDINVINTTENVGKEDTVVKIDDISYTVSRAKIGAELPTEIQYTRPGDAIVLGKAKSGSTEANGLTITNNSNLTIRLRLKVNKNAATKAKAQLEAMENAGWKLYINGEHTRIADLNTGINLGIIDANDTIDSVDVRFELPLDSGNEYQNDIAAGETELAKLNLNDLIEIQATQENNPGWNQDGSDDIISDDTVITQPENGQDQPEGQ